MFFTFYLPRVFGWDDDEAAAEAAARASGEGAGPAIAAVSAEAGLVGVFHGRPKLRAWFRGRMLRGCPEAAAVARDMTSALAARWAAGGVHDVVAAVRGNEDLARVVATARAAGNAAGADGDGGAAPLKWRYP